jgi:hypothetical protein
MNNQGLRGQDRIDLLNDLALGELSHQRIADKYGRVLQTIREWSARNHAEIAGRRREMNGELASDLVHVRTASKARCVEIRDKVIAETEAELENPKLTQGMLVRLTRTLDMLLLHQAEELGQLPTRAIPTENYGGLKLGGTLIEDEAGNLYGVPPQ